MGPTGAGRTRQAFSDVKNRQDVASAASTVVEELAANHEFTKEEVEAILNEKPKAKKFDLKVKSALYIDFNIVICLFVLLLNVAVVDYLV